MAYKRGWDGNGRWVNVSRWQMASRNCPPGLVKEELSRVGKALPIGGGITGGHHRRYSRKNRNSKGDFNNTALPPRFLYIPMAISPACITEKTKTQYLR